MDEFLMKRTLTLDQLNDLNIMKKAYFDSNNKPQAEFENHIKTGFIDYSVKTLKSVLKKNNFFKLI